jgi:TonB family protein
LKKQPAAFVPPKPVREVRPSLTERESALVVRPMPVDVKVYVGENGKVEFAELMTNGPKPELANAAIYAARKWTFTPAKAGEESVPGEVILHFRFAPVE